METSAIIEWGGFAIIVLLVFAETGLLLGLVIPGGETLVFTAGLLVSTGTLSSPLVVLLIALIIAALAGDISGYLIGKRMGKKLYSKKDTWYFKRKYLMMAEDFVKTHSRKSLILGKFLPVIRPFMPVTSGVTNVKKPVFITLSVAACVAYMCVFVLGGYFIGSQFPIIQQYIGWILPISIVISVLIFLRQARKYKRNMSDAG